jgi:uncharacterized protein (DUF58 family)
MRPPPVSADDARAVSRLPSASDSAASQPADDGSACLGWRPSARAARLLTVAAVALAAGFATGRPVVVALAAGPLALLAAGAAAPAARSVRLAASWDTRRCLEGDRLVVALRLTAEHADADVPRLLLPATVGVVAGCWEGAGRYVVTLLPHRWGVLECRVRVRLSAGWGLWATEVVLPAGAVTVLPRAPRLRRLPAPERLIPRLGEHVGAAVGAGVEFAGLREYQPGDPVRELNAAASSRRGRPYVTERAAERASDVVVAVDVFTDVGPAGDSSLDLAVRGAVGVARSALHHRDRVGLVVLGGLLRWLRPESGDRQFYRIVEAVLEARRWSLSQVRPEASRLPRSVLAPRSTVVVFSPLLDERAVPLLHDLRRRGARVLVVDVLRAEPQAARPDGPDALAVRVWRLRRVALRHALRGAGIPVARWTDGPLEAVLAALPHQVRGAR